MHINNHMIIFVDAVILVIMHLVTRDQCFCVFCFTIPQFGSRKVIFDAKSDPQNFFFCFSWGVANLGDIK